jgi:hypothetical protein
MLGEIGQRLKGGLQYLLVTFLGTTVNIRVHQGQDLTIQPGDAISAGTGSTGRTMTIKGGLAASATGVNVATGGAVAITGGDPPALFGSNGGGSGGNVNITGGAGLGGSSGNGGNVVITGGAGTGGNNAGGVTITNGAGGSPLIQIVGAAGTGGAITIKSGSSGGAAGGALLIQSGDGTSLNAGGTMTLRPGDSSNEVGQHLLLQGAAASGGNRLGGHVKLQGGAASGTGGSGCVITLTPTADQAYSKQVPTTGFSITIANNIRTLILDPAGTLATGTITMPATATDGQSVRITSTQIITALTVSPNSGQSITNAPTAFNPNLTGAQGYEFIYVAANTTWYRLQ